jgi:hypothetical protein
MINSLSFTSSVSIKSHSKFGIIFLKPSILIHFVENLIKKMETKTLIFENNIYLYDNEVLRFDWNCH